MSTEDRAMRERISRRAYEPRYESDRAALDRAEIDRMIDTATSGQHCADTVRGALRTEAEYQKYEAEQSRRMSETIQDTAQSVMDQIIERLQTLAFQADEIARGLHNHADRLTGDFPRDEPAPGAGGVDPKRSALDRVFMALDRVDRAMGDVQTAAVRNTGLA